MCASEVNRLLNKKNCSQRYVKASHPAGGRCSSDKAKGSKGLSFSCLYCLFNILLVQALNTSFKNSRQRFSSSTPLTASNPNSLRGYSSQEPFACRWEGWGYLWSSKLPGGPVSSISGPDYASLRLAWPHNHHLHVPHLYSPPTALLGFETLYSTSCHCVNVRRFPSPCCAPTKGPGFCPGRGVMKHASPA